MMQIRNILAVLLLTMPMALWGQSNGATVEVVDNNIKYKLDEDKKEAMVVAYESDDDKSLYTGNIVIRAQIKYNSKDYTVNGVDINAFEDSEELETVRFEPGINAQIYSECFNGCEKLYLIDFQDVRLKADTDPGPFDKHFLHCYDLRYIITNTNNYADQSPFVEATKIENIYMGGTHPDSVEVKIYAPEVNWTPEESPTRLRKYNSVMIPKGFHWASFVSYTDVDFDTDDQGNDKSEHIGAYVATQYDATKVTLTRVHKVPKDTPALIYTDEPDGSNDKYIIFNSISDGDDISTNFLNGSTSVRKKVTDKNIYALVNNINYDNSLVNVPQNIYIPPFTAYLKLPAGGTGSQSISIVIDDPTGMDNITTDESVNQLMYLLNGKVAPEGYKGVVIMNGKKVIIK